MGKMWMGQRKKDQYYKRAKSEGYFSRAAYKLKFINQRFKLFGPGDIVVDLGSAPGGWLQVASETVGETGLAVGVDLKRTRDVPNALSFNGDFLRERSVDRLIKLIKENVTGETEDEESDYEDEKEVVDDRCIDCVLSDMSPNISGNYSLDHFKSVELCRASAAFAREHLIPGGNYCAKIFQGEEYPVFLSELRHYFDEVRGHKTKASRNQSSEIYVIAMGLRV